MPKKKGQKQLVDAITKVMNGVEAIKKRDLVPPELGVYFCIAIIKDKSIITDVISFDTNELGINVENFEKVAIHKRLVKKYKERDTKDKREQKARFKAQIKQAKKEQ